MYNKCDKCSRFMDDKEERKLMLDAKGEITTRCMGCYAKEKKIRR